MGAAALKKHMLAEIDLQELTLRIAEACLGLKRPPELSAKDALDQLRSSNPDIVAGFDKAAVRAAEYLTECINASGHFAELNS